MTCSVPHAAMSYPARLLSRAVNPLSKEVLEHVNVQSSIIVLYDLDGKIAAPACALLSEKGVENVALLHGGDLSDAILYTYLWPEQHCADSLAE